MFGLPLMYEMALAATLACLIAWLAGRALCKNREHELRTDNKKLQAAYAHLEKQQLNQHADTLQLSEHLHTEQLKSATLENKLSHTEHLLNTIQDEQQQTLTELQSLGTYRIRFEELEKAHDDQSRQAVNLTKTVTEYEAQCDQLRTSVQQLQQDKHIADEQHAQQQAALEALRQEQQTLTDETENRDALIARLKQHIAELQHEATEKDAMIEQLNTTISTYMTSVDSTNQRISGLLGTLPSAQHEQQTHV